MERFYILVFVSFGSCLSEWVLLPSIFPKDNKMKSRLTGNLTQDLHRKSSEDKKFQYENAEFCHEIHNLTAMTFGSIFQGEIKPRNAWEISLEDVEEIVKTTKELPKKTRERAKFVKEIEETLLAEAEQRLNNLFSQSREARTKPLDFVSMESALLTISMLLFGVYLSKLILKLLLSHYNRYNGGITMMTGIRTPIKLPHGRKKKSMELQQIQLMHLIDKYNSRFH